MSGHAFDSGASGYDQIFAQITRLFLPALIEAASLRPGETVLDVATGTGAAAQAAAEVVGPTGHVVGGDLSVPMLHQAVRKHMVHPQMYFAAFNGQALPFADQTFDKVLCQLGLMFFPEPKRGLAECLRVLQASGRAAVSVTSAAPERTLYNRVSLAIARHKPAIAQSVERLFALGNPGNLGGLMEQVGFHEVEVCSVSHRIEFPSFDAFFGQVAKGLGSVGQTFVTLAGPAQDAARKEVYWDLLGSGPDRPFAIDMEVLVGSGSRSA